MIARPAPAPRCKIARKTASPLAAASARPARRSCGDGPSKPRTNHPRPQCPGARQTSAELSRGSGRRALPPGFRQCLRLDHGRSLCGGSRFRHGQPRGSDFGMGRLISFSPTARRLAFLLSVMCYRGAITRRPAHQGRLARIAANVTTEAGLEPLGYVSMQLICLPVLVVPVQSP